MPKSQGWLPLLEEADSEGSWQSLHISRSARQPCPGPQMYLRMAGRSVMFMSAWIALSMGCTMNGIAATPHMDTSFSILTQPSASRFHSARGDLRQAAAYVDTCTSKRTKFVSGK